MNAKTKLKLIVVFFVMTCSMMPSSNADADLSRPDWDDFMCYDTRVKWKRKPCGFNVSFDVRYVGRTNRGEYKYAFHSNYGFLGSKNCVKLTLELNGLEKFGITKLEGFAESLFAGSGTTFYKTYPFNQLHGDLLYQKYKQNKESGMKEIDSQHAAIKEGVERWNPLGENPSISVGKVTCEFYEIDEAIKENQEDEQDRVELPDEQDRAELPDEQDRVELPDEQDRVELPDEQDRAELPDEQDRAELPDEQDRVDLPDEQDRVDLPDKTKWDELEQMIRDEEREMRKEENMNPGSPGGGMNQGGVIDRSGRTRRISQSCELAQRRVRQRIARTLATLTRKSSDQCTKLRVYVQMFQTAQRDLANSGCLASVVKQFDRPLAEARQGLRSPYCTNR